jgi:hypothetical protein
LLADLEAAESGQGTAESEQWRRALGRLDETLGPNPASSETAEIPSAQPPELKKRFAGVDRQLPTEILDPSRLPPVQPARAPTPQARPNRAAIWIVAGVAVASLLVLLWVARPQVRLLVAKLHPAQARPDSGAIAQPPDPPAGQPAATSPAQNPPACKSIAFTLDQYGDLLTGELHWTGTLGGGMQLEIVNRRASTGSVQGDIFPRGVPVRLFVTPARVRVVTAPAAENCWDPHLVLENIGDTKSEVRIQWEVFQP